MRTVSQGYATGANKNIRNVNVAIKDINDTVMYSAADIISISVQKCITDGSLGIGFASSDRLNLQVVSARKVPKMTWLRVYVSFDGHEEIFGKFVCDECTRDGSVITITAYDAMYYQSKKTVRFTGAPDLQLEALTFPCSMQDMLNYICRLRNITTDFACQSFTVSELPQKDESNFYSVRELIGFIAACHGCNAKLDPSNKLIIKPFEAVNYTANTSDVIDLTIDDSKPFEVTGVLFTVNNETSIYIDDVEGSEYDEDDVGVITCFNPLATVEIAEYVWSQIGGLSYYGGNLTQRGKGIIEVGDVITVGNLKYPADTGTYPLCVTSIDYSITADGGFVETLGSDAAKSSEQMSSGAGGSSGGSGGTGKFLDSGHTSVAHNDTEHNTSTLLYDSINGYNNSSSRVLYPAETKGGNLMTGWNNVLIDGQAVLMYGIGNTVERCAESEIGGRDNTGYQVSYSTVNGQNNDITNIANSAVFGEGHTISELWAGFVSGRNHTIHPYNEVSMAGLAVFGNGATITTADRYKFVIAHNGNIFTVDVNGNVTASGTITPGGADYAECCEWADGNPNNEDRCGLLVTLRGDMIVPAHGDDIIGVISGRATVIGNAFELYWHGKYLTDAYGRIVTDKNGDPVISPEYDPSRVYVPRLQRPEWDAVGLVGRLIVRDNGKCAVGGYVSARNGTAVPTTARTGIRVLRRVDETHIEVLIK